MKKIDIHRLKKYIVALGITGLMVVSILIPATAFAATAQSSSSTKCGTNVKCVISAGDLLITHRQDSLNTLNTKVSSYLSTHKITTDQASTIQSDITSNQSSLTGLKAKLDAETTVDAARADVQNIYTQLRIYAVVLPRDYRQLEWDIESNVQSTMQNSIPKLQDAIAKASSSNQAKLKPLFSDYQKQVSDAQTQLQSIKGDFAQLTAANFDQNRSAYQQTRLAISKAEKAAHEDLKKASADLQTMSGILGL